MLQIGIIGPATAIQRHTIALNRLQGIRITGRWITEREKESATDAETGVSCMIPSKIIGTSDAMIIATPEPFGMMMAVAALREGRHVYLYPQAISSVTEATYLIKLAREANAILMAGKSGNEFLNCLLHAVPDVRHAGMIELQHNYQSRGTRSSRGIYEALLADLEVIHSFVKARVISVKAKGMCLLDADPDIVSARLEYDNGSTVNFSCNLVAAEGSFNGTLVLKNKILKYDFLNGELISWHVSKGETTSRSSFTAETLRFEKSDPLVGDLLDFIDVIRSGTAFLMMHDNGFEPYMLTDKILEKVMKTLVRC